MSAFWQSVIGLGAVVVGALAIPTLGMRLLAPSLESSARRSLNYRGRTVFLGLGIVWVFWAIGLYVLAFVTSGTHVLLAVQMGIVAHVFPILLVFLFGLIDDDFGTSGDKGLGGHLRSLAGGRLTTGALKLMGIGLAALWASAGVMLSRSLETDWAPPVYVAGIIAGAVLIAGAANLLNLLDLRPGRALKSYAALVGAAWVVMLSSTALHAQGSYSWIELVALAIVYAGPVFAVWHYDAGERGMLGDAGANPAGALAGIALMAALPLSGIVVAALMVVALNLASERISFSQVIASNRVLSWLDGIGRLPENASTEATVLSDVPPRNGENDG